MDAWCKGLNRNRVLYNWHCNRINSSQSVLKLLIIKQVLLAEAQFLIKHKSQSAEYIALGMVMLQFNASLICFNKKRKQETEDRTHLHSSQITSREHSVPKNGERPPKMIINNRIFLRCYTVAHVLHFQRVVSILFRNVAKKVLTVLSISIFT